MPSITLTRQQLYDRAWTPPLDALAKELGLSGRGLGKLCDRHNIPVPPRGWWAKKAAGYLVKQTPLPAAAAGTHTRFNFRGPGAENQSVERVRRKRIPSFSTSGRTRIAIEVPEDVPLTNPLVLKTQRLLNKRTP